MSLVPDLDPAAPLDLTASEPPLTPPAPPAPPSPDTFLGPRGFPQAVTTLATWHKVAAILLILGLIVALFWAGPRSTIFWVNVVFTVFFLIASLYRFLLIDLSLHSHEQIEVVHGELFPPPGGWPRYVIQVPLYKERRALPHLIKSLSALDYPVDRLTIQLLIEEDDEETKAGLREVELRPPFTVVNIPVSHPRTKPKACNVGLAYAEGDFLVIYDAEDRPEADQLKKAVVAFHRCAPNVACIQAKLNFYNTDRNLMTRCFTAEYAMWFDLCLPGLDHLRAPIPLGGTSNHFRLDVLKRLKGWDEYNVTEDCDLGLRLFAAGWRTRMLDSTTWEEACPKPLPWLRQRSRWAKGYVQTYLVHTRDLIGVTRRLGVAHSLHFHLLLGGSILSQLLSPFYWFLVVIWLIFHARLHDLGIDTFYPGAVFIMAALCLFVGNFVLVYSCAIGCAIKGCGRVAAYTPLMVLYWIYMSFAAWRGSLQLISNPHFWEKTTHHEL